MVTHQREALRPVAVLASNTPAVVHTRRGIYRPTNRANEVTHNYHSTRTHARTHANTRARAQRIDTHADLLCSWAFDGDGIFAVGGANGQGATAWTTSPDRPRASIRYAWAAHDRWTGGLVDGLVVYCGVERKKNETRAKHPHSRTHAHTHARTHVFTHLNPPG